MTRARLIWLPLALAVMLAASGCASVQRYIPFWQSDESDTSAVEVPARVLATEAEDAYRAGNYSRAAELYQSLKDRYPYGPYALLADLRVADSYHKAERWDEAALAYSDFVRLHPRNEAVPYAIYNQGMVYFKQMLSVDRDPTYARKSAEAFIRLLRQFPNNEWSHKARPRLVEAQRRLAGHEMNVGEFYYRTGKYRAAAGRFKRVVTAYPDVGLYNQALARLQECRLRLAKKPAGEREGKAYRRRDLIQDPGALRPTIERDREQLP